MFMEIAIGSIGIAIVLMVGYLIIAQIRVSLPTPTQVYNNTCLGFGNASATCASFAAMCLPAHPLDNATAAHYTCQDVGFNSGTQGTQVTVYAGFGLLAVGVIVLAAFGLINVFR